MDARFVCFVNNYAVMKTLVHLVIFATLCSAKKLSNDWSYNTCSSSNSPSTQPSFDCTLCSKYFVTSVKVKVIPSDPTSSHDFETSGVDINYSMNEFDVKIRRIDRNEGWAQMPITVIVQESAIDGGEWYAPGNEFAYRVLPSRISYDAAQTACRKIDASLAVAGVKDINIQNKITSFNQKIYRDDRNWLWIGLTDRKEEGIWVWEDGSPLLSSQAYWDPGEPNGGTTENCAQINVKTMNDISCGSTQRSRPLCERRLTV